MHIRAAGCAVALVALLGGCGGSSSSGASAADVVKFVNKYNDDGPAYILKRVDCVEGAQSRVWECSLSDDSGGVTARLTIRASIDGKRFVVLREKWHDPVVEETARKIRELESEQP